MEALIIIKSFVAVLLICILHARSSACCLKICKKKDDFLLVGGTHPHKKWRHWYWNIVSLV